MTFDQWGNGYALTENNLEFIHFTIDYNRNIPNVEQPWVLANDPANGVHDVLTETGGDFCSDGANKLIFVTNSGNVYRINTVPGTNLPKTVTAKFEGTIAINGAPLTGCTGIAMDAAGYLYVGGVNTSLYKVTLSTLTATLLSSDVYWATTDFASCVIPTQPARIATGQNTITNNAATNATLFAKVQPNPFNKVLNVQVQLNAAELVQVRMTDFYGRTVFTRSEKLGAGSNSLSLPVPASLSSGTYVLELWAGNKRVLQKKLVKQ
jgi:hypothetical protein